MRTVWFAHIVYLQIHLMRAKGWVWVWVDVWRRTWRRTNFARPHSLPFPSTCIRARATLLQQYALSNLIEVCRPWNNFRTCVSRIGIWNIFRQIQIELMLEHTHKRITRYSHTHIVLASRRKPSATSSSLMSVERLVGLITLDLWEHKHSLVTIFG